jgi:protein gp37
MTTGISWTDETWNPISGCTPISEGCANCYAMAMAKRLQAAGKGGYENGFDITLHPDRLEQPGRWRKPRRVFVCSMGDLFHEDIPYVDIGAVWLAAFNAPRHTFMFLTKRPERLRDWTLAVARHKCWPVEDIWPDWMWIGVTAENQKRAYERIPILLYTPAVHRFVSVEPMLERVHALPYLGEGKIEWVICGGESGPGYRKMEEAWALGLMDQCYMAHIPFHFKQHSGPRPGYNPMLNGLEHRAMPPFEKETP